MAGQRPKSLQTEENNGRPGWGAGSAPEWGVGTLREDRELRDERWGHLTLGMGAKRGPCQELRRGSHRDSRKYPARAPP